MTLNFLEDQDAGDAQFPCRPPEKFVFRQAFEFFALVPLLHNGFYADGPHKLPAIVGKNWSDVGVGADAPSKRAFLAYALTSTAAGGFWRDITDDGKSDPHAFYRRNGG